MDYKIKKFNLVWGTVILGFSFINDILSFRVNLPSDVDVQEQNCHFGLRKQQAIELRDHLSYLIDQME
jgi:hypothetical protein